MAPTVSQYIIFISKTKAVLIRMWHLRSTFGTFFKESLLSPFGPIIPYGAKLGAKAVQGMGERWHEEKACLVCNPMFQPK